MKGSRLLVGALALGAASFVASSAWATMPMMKDAKQAGIEVKGGCLFCHVDKLPKKGKAENNDRGKWLVAEKEKRQAKEIDVTWLKDYVEPAEAK
jgi:hypothetical protein